MNGILQRIQDRRAAGAAVLIVCVLAGAGFLLFYHLGTEPFQDYDEATYAEITAEGLAAHQYVALSFLDQPYFRKPPLLFWLNDVSKSVIASPEVADRLSSALSAFLLVALLILITYEVTGSVAAGALAGAALATTAAFIEPARQVRFDILLSFFDVLVLYTFWKSFGDRRWFLAFGAAAGLAVLSKGPLILYAAVAVFVMACVMRRFKWLLEPYFWGGVFIALAIVLPWHIYESLRYGMQFWQMYLGDQVVSRVGTALFTNQPTNLGYLNYAFSFAAPWTEIFCIVIFCMIPLSRRVPQKIQAWFWAAVAGALSVFVIAFVTKTKAFSYLIGAYPFIALAVALGAYEIQKQFTKLERGVVALALAGCVLCGFIWSVDNGFHSNSYYSYEVGLAYEEQYIGELLKESRAQTFYVDNVTLLGDIMFYSRLVTPQFLQPSVPPPVGAYILYTAGELAQLREMYPQDTFSEIYDGTWLSLVQISATRP